MSDKDEPKARGGRRRRKPDEAKQYVSEASLKNLRKWKPGESGNPLGKPKSLVEITRLARELTPGAIMKLNEIVYNPEAPFRDQIAAAVAIADRGCGRPAVGIFHGGSSQGTVFSGAPDMDGEPATALIRAAAKGGTLAQSKAQLLAELRRIEALEAQEKAELSDELAEARAAQARGEDIPGILALLIRAKDSNEGAERAPKSAPPRPDFIADSSGSIVAAPAPSSESAPEPAAIPESPKNEPTPAPPKAPPFQVESEPSPAPKPKAAPPPKATHPGANMPGFCRVFVRAGDEPSRCRAREEGGRGPSARPQSDQCGGGVSAGPARRIPGSRGIRRVG